MTTSSWRERVRAEEELLTQLSLQVSQAAQRRAVALREGVAELGSVYAVANELGRSWQAVDKVLKKQHKKPPEQGPTTTE
ncbi:hypothetical protein [Streptomyces carpaticus]|uniref:hypothetical protein n=1 Tax=Streptomyces carpaticus TaxID=285558 RepID=UPI0031FA338E